MTNYKYTNYKLYKYTNYKLYPAQKQNPWQCVGTKYRE